jgi:calnexin
MQKDILFDNIYIGHSIADAEKLKAESFDLKNAAEKADEEANKPKPAEDIKSPSDLVFKDDPVRYIKEKTALFAEIAKRDPIEAIKFVPEVAGGIGVIAVTLLALLVSVLLGSGAAPSQEQVKAQAKKAKDAAVDAKDKAAEAISTGAEKAPLLRRCNAMQRVQQQATCGTRSTDEEELGSTMIPQSQCSIFLNF